MLLALKMEERTMSLGMPDDLQTLEKARKQIFPTECLERRALPTP